MTMESANDAITARDTSPGEILRRRLENLVGQCEQFRQGDTSRRSLHELRIQCRRSESMLRLCDSNHAFRSMRWLRRRLRQLRRAGNPTRDDDVLKQWLNQHGLATPDILATLSARRKRQIKRMIRLTGELLDSAKFDKSVRKSIAQAQQMAADGKSSAVLGRGILHEWLHFVAAIPAHLDRPPELHAMRIAGKRLRYSIDNLSELCPQISLGDLQRFLKTLQAHLGKIQDAVVRARQFKTLGSKIDESAAAVEWVDHTTLVHAFTDWFQSEPPNRLFAESAAIILSLVWSKRSG